jgi:hypothetical protein
VPRQPQQNTAFRKFNSIQKEAAAKEIVKIEYITVPKYQWLRLNQRLDAIEDCLGFRIANRQGNGE